MRRSQRITSSGQKSRYFDDDVNELDTWERPRPSDSQFKTRRVVTESSDNFHPDGESDLIDGSEESGQVRAPTPRKRGRPRKSTPKQQSHVNPDNLVSRPRKRGRRNDSASLKHDESISDDDRGADGEEDLPRIEIIPLPKLRDNNGVEYQRGRLHPNTMLFLTDLKANNKRSWLKMRDPEYRRSLEDWQSFVETLTEEVIGADETIPELPLKDVIFRIYRDIRFSKDPTPYKPHYSAAWSRTGRKGPYACYYVHCEPGSCFVGGGLWHPQKDALARLRANIDERPQRLRQVLMNPEFRRAFLPEAKNDEESVLAAFAESNKENALKTKPQGFHPEHRDIELLKLRNYTVGRKIDDSELTGGDAQDRIMAIIRPMVEYVTFLNNVVMPDPDFDDDDSDEESHDEQVAEE
ncbi:hypothetical protein BJ170DRAFT_616086 [Xylariales sp. AK1849]|nr:hypothetical protein BJ170DRAFT_616086 [Xylariales sp. AK1849]